MLPPDFLAQLRAAFPKRDGGGDGKRIVTRLVEKAISEGATWERMLLGAQNYNRWCGRKGATGTEWVMMLQTFVGKDWHFDDWADKDIRTRQQIAEDERWKAVEAAAKELGFTEVKRDRGIEVAETAVRLADQKRLRIVR